METHLDSWLMNNNINVDMKKIIVLEPAWVIFIFFAMYKFSHVYNLPAIYYHHAHSYLRSLLAESGVI